VSSQLQFLVSHVLSSSLCACLNDVYLIAVMIVTIGVGIQDRPAAAPAVGDWMKDVVIFGSPTFATAMSCVGSLLFAFAGMPS
jgi:hypothetical protein